MVRKRVWCCPEEEEHQLSHQSETSAASSTTLVLLRRLLNNLLALTLPINLTEGAISMLSSGELPGTDIKPVLQIAKRRMVNTSNQNNERYRIFISDGVFMQQGMLAMQHNELVRSEKLQKSSIFQLKQFVCNLIQNCRQQLLSIEEKGG